MRKFTVNIVGKEFVIIGRDDEQRVKDVAKIVEKEYLEVDKSYPSLSISDKAFLTAMTITDNSFADSNARIIDEQQEKINTLVNDIIDLKEELNGANSAVAKKQDKNDVLKIELIEKNKKIENLEMLLENKEQEIDDIANESLNKQRELFKLKEYVSKLHMELEKANVIFEDAGEFELDFEPESEPEPEQDLDEKSDEDDIKLYSNE